MWHGTTLKAVDCFDVVLLMYCVSSKCHCTSKSRHPQNVATCFCKLIPINAALEISPHGQGSPATYICAHVLYMDTNRLSCVCACLSISIDAALKV